MIKLLGEDLYELLQRKTSVDHIQEIRVRLQKNIYVKTSETAFTLPFVPTQAYIDGIFNLASGYSRYAHEDDIASGFLSYGNGIRIGLCGDCKINDKGYLAYQKVSSLCIRIPHRIEFPSCAKKLLRPFHNTLIYGAPFSGKTTFIRSFAEALSEQYDTLIIDERYEISGQSFDCFQSSRADIIRGVPKKYVYENVVRSMAPEIIVCDELFTENDILAINNFSRSGIRCLASYHSDKKEKIPIDLQKVFSNYICLTYIPTAGTIQSIERYDT